MLVLYLRGLNICVYPYSAMLSLKLSRGLWTRTREQTASGAMIPTQNPCMHG